MPDDINTFTTADARDQLREMIDRASIGKARIALTRRGKAVAAVVPIDDLQTLEAWEEAADVEAARDALAEIEAGAPPIPWEDIKKKHGL